MVAWPVTAPPPVPAPPGVQGRLARRVGVALLVLAALGGFLWFRAFSTFGFDRFDAAGISARLEIPRDGTYVVYEEYEGASGDPGPAAVRVTFTSASGRRVAVSPLLDDDDRSPTVYRSPWHEGRAIGTAVLDAGTYTVTVTPTTVGADGLEIPAPGEVVVAIGPETSRSWAGSWVGLLPFVAVPAIAGLALLLGAPRRPR